ncbi:MAG: response regulator [Thermodesulfovibrionales bacterium]|nr:response regulator [Thermodesulfovibrionales bacterium]
MFRSDIRILVVDDFSTTRKILRNMLEQIGFEHIEEAEDCMQALDKLKEGNLGLVISDCNMPNKNRLEMLKEIKQNPLFKKLPFLFVTEQAGKEKVIEAIKAGADDYLIMPLTVETLRTKLKKILEKGTTLF